MRPSTTSSLASSWALLSLLLPTLASAGSIVDPLAAQRNHYLPLADFDPHSDYVPPPAIRKRGVCSSKTRTATATAKGTAVVVTTRARPTTTKTTTTHLTSRTTTKTATATPKPSSTPSHHGTVGAYFPDWNLDVMTPSQISYSRFDWIQFAFAIPDKNFALEFTQDDSISTLKSLVSNGHAHGTLISLSIGGWTGSKYFSEAVRTSANRAKFVSNIANLVKTYNLDGIDIDWEYPGTQGQSGNIVSSSDLSNMIAFFQLLRSTLGTKKRITAAVTDFTWTGSNGNHVSDVSALAKLLDGILVMNYDVWGASSNPGPNAPFSMPCSSQQPGVDMVSAIETWTKAGMPKSKIVMGLAAYGYINWSTKTSLVHRKRSFSSRSAHARRGRQHTRSVEAEPTLGELMSGVKVKRQQTRFERYLESAEKRRALRSGATLDHLVHSRAKRQNSCPNPDVDCQGVNNVLPPVANDTVIGSPATTTTTTTAAGNGLGIGQIGNIKATGNGNLASYPDSQIEFADIIGWGVLTSSFKGANGYTVAWDSCSSTPFAYNQLRKTVVTYDDPRSIGIKSAYARTSGIQGVGFWEMTGDYDWALTDAARSNIGAS